MSARSPVRAPRLFAVTTVARREFAATFDSSIAAASTIAAWLVAHSIFMNEFFLAGRVDMAPFWERLPLIAIALFAALSMRLWAEERRARTFEVLVTLPLTASELVLGKFAAVLGVWILFLLGTLPIPIMLCVLGEPDLGLLASGYLAAFFLGALLLAVGETLSALTSDQIVAFVLTSLVATALYYSGDPRLVAVLDGLAPALAAGSWIQDTLSVQPHYRELAGGLLSLGTLVYFVGLTALALALAAGLVRRLRT